jgi:demethylmenaquinone methyltransferase/2-methoxy-6-polyprenyl-1,4-benzoquinol methylase
VADAAGCVETAGSTTAPPGANRRARELFDRLPARYDTLAEVLSLGQNRRWRRALVEAVAAGRPARVLDVATGTAGVALALRARTGATVVGVDLTEAMLRRGSGAVARAGATGICLVLGRGEQLPFPDRSFDAVSFTYLLRYVEDPAATVVELARVLRPGGTLANLEFLVPPSRFWRAGWWGYTRAVLPVAGLVCGGRSWMRVGRFLGPSISGHYRRYPLDWTRRAWEDAGLTGVTVRPMSLGGGLVMWGRRAESGAGGSAP